MVDTIMLKTMCSSCDAMGEEKKKKKEKQVRGNTRPFLTRGRQ